MVVYIRMVSVKMRMRILYFNLTIFCLVKSSVQVLKPLEIIELSKSRCVFTKAALSTNGTTTIFQKLAECYKSEFSVLFGEIQFEEFKWPDGTTLLKFLTERKKIPSTCSELVLFKKTTIDRACLSCTDNFGVYPETIVFDGPLHIAKIIDFINDNCFTFIAQSGQLTPAGWHRQYILTNLFSVSSMTDSLSIKEIKSTVGNLNFLPLNITCDLSSAKSTVWTPSENVQENRCSSKREIPNVVSEIPKCSRINRHITKDEFFQMFVQTHKPVIIEQGITDWRAFTKWTNEFFRNEYGENLVNVQLTPGGDFEGIDQASKFENFHNFEIDSKAKAKLMFPDLVVVRPASLDMKFADFLDLIEWAAVQSSRNVSAYLEYSSIPDYLPELLDDIIEPSFLSQQLELMHINIWLSDGNTLGRLHFDPFDNLLCQLRGKKQVIMFDPRDNQQLYEAHIPEAYLGYNSTDHSFTRKELIARTAMVMSPIDLLNPDLDRFPKFADARPINCTLNEGDILFMPSFWWHEVYSWPNDQEKRNLAVNFWYEPFLTKEFPCAECPFDINEIYKELL